MSRYDRKTGASKPTAMDHVRVGGWAEVCVGEWTGDNERVVFGNVVCISGGRITIRITDEVFSPAKTGLRDGEEIEVGLEDIFGSEYSPSQTELEARGIQWEIECELIERHQAEFDAFCPPEYAISRIPSISPENWDSWCKGLELVRRAFVERLIQIGLVSAVGVANCGLA
jgi:hypothetical protein